MVAWNRRFHPMVVAAREMVEARGPIAQIVGEFHKPLTRIMKWERYAPEVMDNMLYETPIHAIDLVRALAGSDVVQVHSVVSRRFSKYKDVHAALVEFENGCVVSITANYTTDARLERYEVHGRDVSAYLEGVREGYVQVDGGRVEIESTGSNGTVEQARHFFDAIRNGTPIGPPAADLDEAVKTMKLLAAIMDGLPRIAGAVHNRHERTKGEIVNEEVRRRLEERIEEGIEQMHDTAHKLRMVAGKTPASKVWTDLPLHLGRAVSIRTSA